MKIKNLDIKQSLQSNERFLTRGVMGGAKKKKKDQWHVVSGCLCFGVNDEGTPLSEYFVRRPRGSGRLTAGVRNKFSVFCSSEALGRTRGATDSKWLERQIHNISILTKKANNIDEFTVHLQCRCETFIKHWFWRMWKGDYKRSFFATFTIHCFLCNIHDTLSFQLQRNNSTGKPCVHTNMLHETIVVKIIISFIFSKVYEFILIHNIANCYYKQSVYSSSTQHCLQLTVKRWMYKKFNSYFEMPCGLHITDRCR